MLKIDLIDAKYCVPNRTEHVARDFKERICLAITNRSEQQHKQTSPRARAWEMTAKEHKIGNCNAQWRRKAENHKSFNVSILQGFDVEENRA
mmetsp:Transcript_23876/g.35292  ORF Transcript_23876/g.35292 Transcript_23876/m.35292 type:complete len:92 (+) Transcript_23876:671-946(+)